MQRLQRGHSTVKASKPGIRSNSCTQLTDWNIRLCRNQLHKAFFLGSPQEALASGNADFGNTAFENTGSGTMCFAS